MYPERDRTPFFYVGGTHENRLYLKHDDEDLTLTARIAPAMKSFKWHRIPVTLPDSRTEWLIVGVILGLHELVGLVVVAILLVK